MNWQDKAEMREYHRARRAANGELLPELFAMSRAQVGRILGISDVRVGQLERRALRKLRSAFEKLGLDATDMSLSEGGEQKLINRFYRNRATLADTWQETHYNLTTERRTCEHPSRKRTRRTSAAGS